MEPTPKQYTIGCFYSHLVDATLRGVLALNQELAERDRTLTLETIRTALLAEMLKARNMVIENLNNYDIAVEIVEQTGLIVAPTVVQILQFQFNEGRGN